MYYLFESNNLIAIYPSEYVTLAETQLYNLKSINPYAKYSLVKLYSTDGLIKCLTKIKNETSTKGSK